MRTTVTRAVLGLTLLAATPQAFAFGMRGGPGFHAGRGGGPGGPGGPGAPGGPPMRLLVKELSPEQRREVRQILMADRDTRRDVLKQLREAHEALADKMFAAGPLGEADVAPLVERVATLHRQLVEHGAKVMLQVRAVATPEQLAKAAATKAKLDSLRDQIHDLLGEPDDNDDPPPPQ